MTPGLRVTEESGLAEVVIDRPPVNALARETYREIKATFDGFRERDDISAVIFTGAGDRAFTPLHDNDGELLSPGRGLVPPDFAGRGGDGCGAPGRAGWDRS